MKKLNCFFLLISASGRVTGTEMQKERLHISTHTQRATSDSPQPKKQTPKKRQLFSRLQPITSLSRTNYAECRGRSPSNGLCCRGSLEGRSFIPVSTSICPRGLCSSVARRVSLRCLFICCASTSGCVPDCGGEQEKEKPTCVEKRLCAPVALSWFMHICVCTCRLALPVLFPPVCAACAARQRSS